MLTFLLTLYFLNIILDSSLLKIIENYYILIEINFLRNINILTLK